MTGWLLLGDALIVLLLIVVLSRIEKLRNEMKSSAWQLLQSELARASARMTKGKGDTL